MTIKMCEQCAVLIVDRGTRRKLCLECYRAKERARVKAWRDAGNTESRAKPWTNICYKHCEFCSTLFAQPIRGGARRTRCRALECRRAWQNERQAIWAESWKARNGGRYYRGQTAAANNERYKAERAAGVRPTKRQMNPDGYAAGDQLRRAQKAGAEAEKFKPREIFDRDGWVCGICDERVLKSLRYPDPRSASLDHVVPLSRGGAHTRANTRCSHLVCNVGRGNQFDD